MKNKVIVLLCIFSFLISCSRKKPLNMILENPNRNFILVFDPNGIISNDKQIQYGTCNQECALIIPQDRRVVVIHNNLGDFNDFNYTFDSACSYVDHRGLLVVFSDTQGLGGEDLKMKLFYPEFRFEDIDTFNLMLAEDSLFNLYKKNIHKFRN